MDLCALPSVEARVKPRQPRGRFMTRNGFSSTPQRDVPSQGVHEEDRRREVELVATHTDPRDEPECITDRAILKDWAEVARFLHSLQHAKDVERAMETRPDLPPQKRLDDVHRRAKHAHVDLSHEIHLVQRAVDKAREREQPVSASALERLAGLEALLDGVSSRRLAA